MVKRQMALEVNNLITVTNMVLLHPISREALTEEINGVPMTLQMFGIVDSIDLCIQDKGKSQKSRKEAAPVKEINKPAKVSKAPEPAAKASVPPPSAAKPSAPPAATKPSAGAKPTPHKPELLPGSFGQPSSSRKPPGSDGSLQRAPQPTAPAPAPAPAAAAAAASKSPLPKGMHVDPR